MIESEIIGVSQMNNATSSLTFDFLVAFLSDKDERVRRRAVTALGETGDARAVEPLIVALSRELEGDAVSYQIIDEILHALAKIPDRRTLDALGNLESQMTDHGSQRCPTWLPKGVITYYDRDDSRVRRAVPRTIHYKTLETMWRISAKLNFREVLMAARLEEYQREVLQAEIDRLMPILARVFQDYDQPKAHLATTRYDNGQVNMYGGHPKMKTRAMDPMANNNIDAIRRKAETEVSRYLCNNEKKLTLIRNWH